VAILGRGDTGAASALFELSWAAAETARTTLMLAGVLTPQGALHSEQLRADLLAALDQHELAALRARAARLLGDEGRPCQEIAEQIVALPVITEPWMVSVLRKAAGDCADRPDVAARYLRRALQVVPEDVDTRLELAKQLAHIDPDAACAMYAGVLGDVADSEVRASIAARYGMVALRTEHSREAFDVLVGAWRGLPADADPGLRAMIETTVLVVGQGDLATVAPALAHAREISPPTVLRTRLARRLVQQIARSELLIGESVGRTRALTRSALTPLAVPHDLWDLTAAASLHFCGCPAEAAAVVDQVQACTEATGDEPSRILALGVRAWLLLERGDLMRARSVAEQALSLSAEELSHDLQWPRLALASVCARTGENERAARLLAGLRPAREPIEHGLVSTAKALVLRNRGDLPAALDLLLGCGEEFEARGVRNPVLVPWWVDAVSLLVELGRTTEAGEVAERGAEAAGRWDTPAGRGYALLAAGMVNGQVEMAQDAALLLEAAGCGLYETQALTVLGSVLLRHGDDKAARKHLRAAADLAVRCGDVHAASRARSLLVAAGGRMGEVSAGTRDALTDTERQVAELAAAGLTNRQIADARFVTVATVESHLSNAYRKLGVRTRAGLAARLR